MKIKQLFDSDSEDSALSAVATSIPTIPEPLGSDIQPMRRTRRRELSTESSGEEIEVGGGISLTQEEVDRLLAEPQELVADHTGGPPGEGTHGIPEIDSAPSHIQVWVESGPSLVGGYQRSRSR